MIFFLSATIVLVQKTISCSNLTHFDQSINQTTQLGNITDEEYLNLKLLANKKKDVSIENDILEINNTLNDMEEFNDCPTNENGECEDKDEFNYTVVRVEGLVRFAMYASDLLQRFLSRRRKGKSFVVKRKIDKREANGSHSTRRDQHISGGEERTNDHQEEKIKEVNENKEEGDKNEVNIIIKKHEYVKEYEKKHWHEKEHESEKEYNDSEEKKLYGKEYHDDERENDGEYEREYNDNQRKIITSEKEINEYERSDEHERRRKEYEQEYDHQQREKTSEKDHNEYQPERRRNRYDEHERRPVQRFKHEDNPSSNDNEEEYDEEAERRRHEREDIRDYDDLNKESRRDYEREYDDGDQLLIT